MLPNPYLAEYYRITRGVMDGEAFNRHFEKLGFPQLKKPPMKLPFKVPRLYRVDTLIYRDKLTDLFAWAIPNERALREIGKCGPIVEIGAGSGYWAALLRARGADVRAFDIAPPDRAKNGWHQTSRVTWVPVEEGDESQAAEHPDRALMLCWPPYRGGMAARALEAYQGKTVIFIGEGEGGCCADDAFFERLVKDYEFAVDVRIPQWPSIHDYLSIWRRK